MFNNFFQDKWVCVEQSKYELIQRMRVFVIGRYKWVYQEFLDLEVGFQSVKNWYKEMREMVESMEKNVDMFVNNWWFEGVQLFN